MSNNSLHDNPRARNFHSSASQASMSKSSETSAVTPEITYNIICNNEPKDGFLARTTGQSTENQQQVLAQLPFQVNADVVYNEEELFQLMYDRFVGKLEADRDASSAGKHD